VVMATPTMPVRSQKPDIENVIIKSHIVMLINKVILGLELQKKNLIHNDMAFLLRQT
jgi:hypothetical protein